MPLHPALHNVKPTSKSYQPDHSMVSSKFNSFMSCTNRQFSKEEIPFTTPFLCVLCAYNNIIVSQLQPLSYIYFQKICKQKKKAPKWSPYFHLSNPNRILFSFSYSLKACSCTFRIYSDSSLERLGKPNSFLNSSKLIKLSD